MKRRFLISGQVQGVGYRMYARQKAKDCKVFGWVRNLSDGRVECMAQGNENQLHLLQIFLEQGPPSGQVDDIVVENIDDESDYVDFEILKDGFKPWSQS